MINLGVENFSNFIFEFTLNFDWRRRRLSAVWDFVGDCRFKHRDMKDWMNTMDGVREMEGEGM